MDDRELMWLGAGRGAQDLGGVACWQELSENARICCHYSIYGPDSEHCVNPSYKITLFRRN